MQAEGKQMSTGVNHVEVMYCIQPLKTVYIRATCQMMGQLQPRVIAQRIREFKITRLKAGTAWYQASSFQLEIFTRDLENELLRTFGQQFKVEIHPPREKKGQ